jgi:hypothetical protein
MGCDQRETDINVEGRRNYPTRKLIKLLAWVITLVRQIYKGTYRSRVEVP